MLVGNDWERRLEPATTGSADFRRQSMHTEVCAPSDLEAQLSLAKLGAPTLVGNAR